MTPIELLHEIHRHGARIVIRGGKPQAVPKGALPPDLLAEARARRDELVALVVDQTAAERIARLDAERHTADRLAKRGYDFDTSAPSYHGPAKSLIQTCVEFGIPLRLDTDGVLVVGPGAWRSLVEALEIHVDEVVRLIVKGQVYDA